MKRTIVLLTVLILVTATAFAAKIPGKGPKAQGPGGSGEVTCLSRVVAILPAVEPDAQEVASILFMREEEKLARDVYLALDDLWGLRVFRNISQSEQNHMDLVALLIDKYGLTDPVQDNPRGVFQNPALQQLHDELVAQGSDSLLAALEVGATIEDLDINDLHQALQQTNNLDVMTVFQNLLKGSRNHLRAFVDLLASNDSTYEPQYLDPVTFDAIVSAPQERGVVDAYGDLDNSLCPGDGPKAKAKKKGRR